MTGDTTAVSEPKGASDTTRISEVKTWLTSQFESSGREVPNFDSTHQSITHLYNLSTASQAKSHSATLLANDFRQKGSEYRAQAAWIREVLECVGMAHESLPSNVVSSAQVLANVASLLNVRDTEMSRILAQLEEDVVPFESQMENWKTNLEVMAAKEEQYINQYKKYEMLLNRVGYSTKISHRELVEMAEHKKELEKMTKPVIDTLRSYQDLPPDKALAALAIQDKKRQFAAAEKYLEEVLQSALETIDE